MSEKKQTKKTFDEDFDFYDFEFKTIEDFEIYNKHVHRFNRVHDQKMHIRVKVPDETHHKKVKIKFQRFDQPENVLKARMRKKELDWSGQLKPGCTYVLPVPVVRYLNGLATPIFKEVKTVDEVGDTLTETKQVGEQSRFSCQLMDIV